MIETYTTEVMQKRRNSRWFWIMVCIFAIFLYFFFQGYYPDVRLGFKRIFGESTAYPPDESFEDFIRSFGIINVKTSPTTATILIGSGVYGNNEKRMTNYGVYTMNIGHPGYIDNTLEFTIDKEKPYFIEDISLLGIPEYTEIFDIRSVYQLDSDTYVLNTSSGLIASGNTSNAGIIHTHDNLSHLGGRYFQSGTILYNWENGRLIRSNPERENFVETCPQVQWLKNNAFYCSSVGSLYTESSVYMTGITAIVGRFGLSESGKLIDIYDGYNTILADYSGALESLHILDNTYYIGSGGTLMELYTGREAIITGLDSIVSAQIVSTEIVIMGYREGKKYLLIRHKKDPSDRMRTVKFPDHLDYENTEFIDIEGNIFIKNPDALLFLYRGSNELIWIVEGIVLATYPEGAIYKKDNSLWQASWKLNK